jgi:Protein of unknown function (DUF3558)
VVRTRLLALAVAAALLTPVSAACSGGSPSSQPPSPPSATANAVHGPFLPECGGVSDQAVAQLMGVPGAVSTARNSVGCQWLPYGGLRWPQFWFTWYRGSPIERERKGDERMGRSVTDINIDGHPGYIAVASAKRGNNLCTVGIQYHDDFFEWSIGFSQDPFPQPCDIAKGLVRQTIAATEGPNR